MSEYADGHERKCYMWVVRGGLEHPEHKITHSNCNIHAKCYFADAVKATGSKTADSQNFKFFKNFRSYQLLLKTMGKLTNYLDYSFLTPDTNAAERAVKPFVMARKNFLFSGSGTGAKITCFIFVEILDVYKRTKYKDTCINCIMTSILSIR